MPILHPTQTDRQKKPSAANFFFRGASPAKIFYILAGIFLIFYVLQIPRQSSSADVLTFAARSTADSPIFRYAFLDESSNLGEPVPANYHPAHTAVLWLVYRIAPEGLKQTIVPAGFVSALCGALAVGLIFLIALQLGIGRIPAVYTALVVGLVPSIWFHSLIGEIYVPQLAAISLFVYFALIGRTALSTLSLLLALLVTPFSILALPFVFLKEINRKVIQKTFLIGSLSTAAYLAVLILLDINLIDSFFTAMPDSSSLSFFIRLSRLGVFLVLNLNLGLLFLFWGLGKLWRGDRRFLFRLALAGTPQVVFSLSLPIFVIELGCFQVPLFWLLAFPVGIAVSGMGRRRRVLGLAALAVVIAVFIIFWKIPDRSLALDRIQAGNWLEQNVPDSIKLAAHWRTGVGIALERYNWNFQKLSNRFIISAYSDEKMLLESGEESLIIALSKGPFYSRLLAKLSISGISIPSFEPDRSLEKSRAQKIFGNSSVVLYRWQRQNP